MYNSAILVIARLCLSASVCPAEVLANCSDAWSSSAPASPAAAAATCYVPPAALPAAHICHGRPSTDPTTHRPVRPCRSSCPHPLPPPVNSRRRPGRLPAGQSGSSSSSAGGAGGGGERILTVVMIDVTIIGAARPLSLPPPPPIATTCDLCVCVYIYQMRSLPTVVARCARPTYLARWRCGIRSTDATSHVTSGPIGPTQSFHRLHSSGRRRRPGPGVSH